MGCSIFLFIQLVLVVVRPFNTAAQVASGATTDTFFFTKNPQKQDVEEGKMFRMECQVNTEDPRIIYTWKRNDELINADTRQTLVLQRDLKIFPADRDLDDGFYNCVAINKSSGFTVKSPNAHVNVFYMDPDVRVVLVEPARQEDIKVNVKVSLRCSAQANPIVKASNIKWYHNGNSKLPPESSVSPDGILSFTTKVFHNGFYNCKVHHPAGNIDSRPPFTIALVDGAMDTSINDNDFLRQVRVGQRVQIACPLEPGYVSNWLFTPKLNIIPETKLDSSVAWDKSKTTLTIPRLSTTTTGFYICQAKTLDKSKPSKYFGFHVEIAKNYRLEKNQFSPMPNANNLYVIKKGVDFTLRFYIDLTPNSDFYQEKIPNPPPTMQWFDSSNKTLESFDTRRDTNKRIYVLKNQHLVIERPIEADNGRYRLMVSNKGGREEMMFEIVVTFPPVFVSKDSQIISVDEDAIFGLNCGIKKYSGPHTNTIWWETDDAKFEYPKSLVNVNETGGLTFAAMKPEFAGVYRCVVTTKGYPQQEFKNPTEIRIEVKEKLKFVNTKDTVFLTENTEGRVPCQVSGYGSVVIAWYRLPDKQRSSQEVRGNRNDLVLERASKTDMGQYMCVATTNYKNTRIEMIVNVIVGVRPSIVLLSPNTTVQVGSTAVLDCQATGSPIPTVEWQVGRLTLSNEDRIVGRMQVLPNNSLVIKNVDKADDTDYFCTVKNYPDFNITKSVNLRVLSYDEYSLLFTEIAESRITRTISIVVSVAVIYLGLIIFLTVYCNYRMRQRKHVRSMRQINGENGHLLERDPNIKPGVGLDYRGNGYCKSKSNITPPDHMTYSSGNPSSQSTLHYNRPNPSFDSASNVSAPLDLCHKLAYPRSKLQLDGLLGRGEFGDVSLCRAANIQEGQSQTLVSVKQLDSRTAAHVHEFQRQMYMFAKLDHDFIVKLLGLCLEDNPTMLILEYCEWGELKHYLVCTRQEKRTAVPPLSQHQKVNMCLQVAMALDHMAKFSCVHRDIASRNILLSSDLNVKVSLLGLSKTVYNTEYHQWNDRLVPLRWLSPEALFDNYTAWSDVWAYAVFVWEVFTLGELPYSNLTDAQVLSSLRFDSLPPLPLAALPAHLHPLISQCWTVQEPHNRPSFDKILVVMGELTVDSDL